MIKNDTSIISSELPEPSPPAGQKTLKLSTASPTQLSIGNTATGVTYAKLCFWSMLLYQTRLLEEVCGEWSFLLKRLAFCILLKSSAVHDRVLHLLSGLWCHFALLQEFIDDT